MADSLTSEERRAANSSRGHTPSSSTTQNSSVSTEPFVDVRNHRVEQDSSPAVNHRPPNSAERIVARSGAPIMRAAAATSGCSGIMVLFIPWPPFRRDRTVAVIASPTPADWLLAAIAGYHMLSCLARCARHGVVLSR